MALSHCTDLSVTEQRLLLVIARSSICTGPDKYEADGPDVDGLTPALRAKRAVFVTLTQSARLRGCIGTIEPVATLARAVADSAHSAAYGDPRFPQMRVDELETAALFGTLAGPAALLEADTVWPDGPIDLSPGNRQSRGRIEVSSSWLRAGGRAVLNDVGMVVSWNEIGSAVQNLTGGALGGTVEGSIDFCCAGLAADKQVSGRLNVEGVPLDALLPDALGSVLGGALDGGISFEGNGASLNEVIETLSGDGSFAVSGFSVEAFDAGVFAALAELEDVSEMDAEALADALRRSSAKRVTVMLESISLSTP